MLLFKSRLALIIAVTILLSAAGSGCNEKPKSETALLIYAPAGAREAIEDLTAAYYRQHKDDRLKIKLVFNSSGRLLTQMEISGEGDLYISSDDYFMEKALSKQLIEEWNIAARFVPAIIVPRGNPADIQALEDLARPGLEVILADNSAAMGRAAEQILLKSGLHEKVTENVVARVATAPQVVLSIALGQGDAGITGTNSIGELGNLVEVIGIPLDYNHPTNISAAILKSAALPEQAEKFIRFILSPAGQEIFKEHGFEPLESG